MNPAVLLLLTVDGLQLGWTVRPATPAEPGSVVVTAVIEEGDLVFVSEGSPAAASFEIVASVEDGAFVRAGGEVAPGDLPASRELVLAGVPAGRHDLTLLVRDLETGSTVRRTTVLEVPLRTASEWSSTALQVEGSRAGGRLAGDVGFTWQVFPPTGQEVPDTLGVGYLLRDTGGTTAYEGWLERIGDGRYRANVPLGMVEPGDYDLLVAAVEGDEILTASTIAIEVHEDWDVWGVDAESTERLVRPIATSDELDALAAAGSREERRAVMAEFWLDRDPNPLSRANEYLETYLERLDYVMERYSFLGTVGIDTDMGQVYALLGPPDILEDMPFETGSRPYQVWTYFTPAITVVFIDNFGCGNYDLATSWPEIRRAYERL
jgi:GWxTD domain-containing protein